MTTKLLKSDVDRLLSDTAFTTILEQIRHDQIVVFMRSNRLDTELREEAHSIIRALDKIEQAIQAVVTDDAIKQKREGRST